MQGSYISVELLNEYYLLPVDATREVMHYIAPNPVPGSPSKVEGILNVRGEMMSISIRAKDA